ncbi:MAG: isoleucine--tRNA ligase [Alphaproteobacteria bacterium]|nr:isoleucine--tRNA ligase [Alphaproteobacteria bacterium]
MTTDHKTDYRSTVFLPQTDFPMRGGLPEKEPEILARWKEIDLHAALRAQAEGRERFVLHDGPPYANGSIHIGHALNKILKDVIVRGHQMLGFDAPYVPGWDCHGLPIEWKIEEQYRAKGLDKDDVPVLQFRAECRAFAAHWKDVQSGEFQRLGVIGDWDHPYMTMTKKAEAQILRELYKFVDNGLLYKGVKPVMWSVVEKTALAEAEIEYQDHTSTTLWIAFPIIKTETAALKDAKVVIWTTTPWTIPANRAIAYGDFDYTVLRVDGVGENALAHIGDILVVADNLYETFLDDSKITEATKLATLKADNLKGTIAAHPFRGRDGSEGAFDYDVPLYRGAFVTLDAGTGFVHIAPGHGEDDFNLGKEYGIAFDETVGDDGRYLPNVKGFAGLCVYTADGKTGDANGAVIRALIEKEALLAKRNIKHAYPHSWRSKAPLIFRTTPQWFIAMDKKIEGQNKTLREVALDAIAKTEWFPAIGENRIRGMVESRPDWCISRQRAWGVPIALFLHKETGAILRDKEVMNRVAAAFDEDGADAWYARPAQDFLGNSYRADDYTQVFDVVDVWFESGSTHAFCLNTALNGNEWPTLSLPATLYLEGSDQHRGWFQSSLLEGCGTLGHAPFEKVLTHGFTLDEQGRKMSKSLGNTVAPQDVYNKMGADILRLWVVSSDFTEDQRIGPDILKQTSDLYRRFRNTLRYLLGALSEFDEAERLDTKAMPELERWILHRLHTVDSIVRTDMARFDLGHLLMTLHNFCNADLSALYFDIRKDSLYCDDKDSIRRRATRTVMDLIFNHLVVWLAPILCFTAEEAWVTRGRQGSVHLQNVPTVPDSWKNDALAKKWELIRAVRRVVTGAMELARKEKKIGAPLQAHPHVYGSKELWASLEGVDLAEIAICSALSLHEDQIPDQAFRLDDVAGVGVMIDLAEGKKCERCWQILPEVGSHADHPDLCTRCRRVVTRRQEGGTSASS